MVLAILVAYSVGGIFTRSIYINAVRFKNIPWLVEKIPEGCHYVNAELVMTKNPKVLSCMARVCDIAELLRDEHFSGYPVVGSKGNLLGLISRDYLYVLLKNKCFAPPMTMRFKEHMTLRRLSG
jgi:predicted transcriptional regulator